MIKKKVLSALYRKHESMQLKYSEFNVLNDKKI